MDAPIRLAMLYSSPLIWQDEKGQVHPIELLDFKREKEIDCKSLKLIRMAIEVLSFLPHSIKVRKPKKK